MISKKKIATILSAIALGGVLLIPGQAANATTEYIGKGTWDHGHDINLFGHYVYSNFLYPTWHSSSAYMHTSSQSFSAYDDCATYDWSNAATGHTWQSVTSTSAYYNY